MSAVELTSHYVQVDLRVHRQVGAGEMVIRRQLKRRSRKAHGAVIDRVASCDAMSPVIPFR